MEEDNHIGESTSNERGGYYDEWYDQTEETKSDLFEILDRKEKEVNIDNIYNELSDE